MHNYLLKRLQLDNNIDDMAQEDRFENNLVDLLVKLKFTEA